MTSLSIVVAAAVISLGVSWGNRYEIIQTPNENIDTVFWIDKGEV